MPLLSQNTLLTLAAYAPSRDGVDIPSTSSGRVYEFACWNWTLSGGRWAASDPLSAPSMVDELIQFDFMDANGIFAVGVNHPPPVPGRYPGCNTDLNFMATNLGAARTVRALGTTPFTPQQTAFAEALVRVMLRANGLTPGAGPYFVVMKSSEWWNTDHWAIGIDVPPNNRRMYVQTVPNTEVAHNCDRVWDEALPDVTVGITGLLQAHIDVLNTVPKAPCFTCAQSHGWLPSVASSWHQCTQCGAIYCPTHGAALGGKLGYFDATRQCGVVGCGGRTQLW